MDHNLEDSLNLDSAMGMDFGNVGDVVVSQADISLDAGSHDGGMHMKFEHIEEQQILMDTGSEEIIDFMGDQFTLQEYSVQDDQTTSATTTEESNQQNILSTQSSDPILDNIQLTQAAVPVKQEIQLQQKNISLKRYLELCQQQAPQPAESAPRAVAIAPKPAPRAVPIAPRPVALVSKSLVKKVPLASVVTAGAKGQTVLTHIGKQLVQLGMVPSTTPKLKLVTSGTSGAANIQYIKANTSQAQIINTRNVTSIQGGKPIMAKVIVQGQSNVDQSNNQQTIITKLLPASTASAPQARYVMQQKTVPISLGNKVLLASPTKQGMKFTKKQQVISVKSPTPKLMPAPPAGTTTKKVVITSNPQQNVILKTTAPPKTAQLTKDGKLVVQSQRSQIHQINVPGKGVQYIRLITNPTPSTTKTASRASVQSLPGQPKSFVLTDSKGNLIQMSSENSNSGQQPHVVSGNSGTSPSKWQQKFVRIAAAPAVPKPTTVTTASLRQSQSLLAPLSHPIKLESSEVSPAEEVVEIQMDGEYSPEAAVHDSKASLQALIADAVQPDPPGQEVEVEYDPRQSPILNENQESMDRDSHERQEEHPLIVIPSNYTKTVPSADDDSRQDDSGSMNLDCEVLTSYDLESPATPTPASEGDMVIKSDFGLRPRRACNCTKSQCLKLYCDCFANGEFCNRCNCNNCYNNLNYEELRQKAIRACLERNPNAFRPKIGKTKLGGPEIIRRHNKGCNCKRSGCLKNYCECYEAKIACTAMCKCFGCRNVEETLHRRRRDLPHPLYRPPPLNELKQPCSFMTSEVIEAVCQCLLAASVESGAGGAGGAGDAEPVRLVLDEFSRCLQDIISASHHAAPQEGHT